MRCNECHNVTSLSTIQHAIHLINNTSFRQLGPVIVEPAAKTGDIAGTGADILGTLGLALDFVAAARFVDTAAEQVVSIAEVLAEVAGTVFAVVVVAVAAEAYHSSAEEKENHHMPLRYSLFAGRSELERRQEIDSCSLHPAHDHVHWHVRCGFLLVLHGHSLESHLVHCDRPFRRDFVDCRHGYCCYYAVRLAAWEYRRPGHAFA